MNNKRVNLFFATFFLFICFLFASFNHNVYAIEEANPEVSIDYYNLSYSSEIYIVYAVSYDNFDPNQSEIKMLFWNEFQEDEYILGTEDYQVIFKGTTTINEKKHYVFYSKGLAAKQLTDQFYCRAYVEVDGVIYYSNVIKYSAIKYLTNLLEKEDLLEVDKILAEKLLEYGAAAQIKFNYNIDTLATDTFFQVELTNAVLPDGFKDGIYKEGTIVTATAVVPDGYEFVEWTNSLGVRVGTESTLEIIVNSNEIYNAVIVEEGTICHHENIIIDPRVEPTCDEEGLTEGSHCGDCGEILVAQEIISALGHTYGEWVEGVDATCTEPGIVGHYHCFVCDKYFDVEYNVISDIVIPALGHDLIHVDAKEPTCTEVGWNEYYYCSRDGIWFGYEEIPATGIHDYEVIYVEPSGVTRGYTLHSCINCDDYWIEDYDYSLYEGMTFTTTNKFLIPYYFNSSTYTIEAAIHLSPSITGRGGVIVGSYGNGKACMNLEVYSEGRLRLYFEVNNVDYNYVFSTDLRSENVINIALTIQKGLAQLYIDGVLVESKVMDDFEIPIVGRSMTIGGDLRSENAQYFKGTLYSLSIFRDIRTKEEIKVDCILADSSDQNCCISYNLLTQDTLTGGSSYENPLEYAEVTDASELEYYASIGTKNIEIMNDLILDRTIYVIGDISIFSNGNYTITRATNFAGDLFVLGENTFGRNLILDDVSSILILGREDAIGILTIDGNKDNVTVEVFGSLIYLNYSGFLTINDGIVLTNNRKVANSRTLDNEQWHNKSAGGAAILINNGSVIMNGGLISNCEVNFEDPANGDESADNYLESIHGGAIFNNSNFTMYGGTISNNSGYYGGAIASFLSCKLYGGVIENNISSHAGGAVYIYTSYSSSAVIGIENENYDNLIFRNNSTNTSGGAIYSGMKSSILILGGLTFDSNYAKSNGGALNIGGYGEIIGDALFINNQANNQGGAIYVTYSGSSNSLERRKVRLNDVEFCNNSAKYGGAISIIGAHVLISDSEFTYNTSINSGGAIFVNRIEGEIGAIVNITDSLFISNSSAEGGALFGDYNVEISIANTLFEENNTSTSYGGAISLHGAKEVTIHNSSFIGNYSLENNAGAVYASYRTINYLDDNGDTYSIAYDSKVLVMDSYFASNIGLYGGAFMGISSNSSNKVAIFENVIFENNSTISDSGGAVNINNSFVDFKNCSFDGNLSAKHGGAISFYGSTAKLVDVEFTNNSGTNGGAVYISSNSCVTIYNVIAINNTATGNGGFIGVNNSHLEIDKSNSMNNKIGDLIDQNKGNLAVGGGAIYIDNYATAHLNNIDFGYNVASSSGGAIYVRNTVDFSLNNCIIANNTAQYGGAIINYGNDVFINNTEFINNTSASGMGGAIYNRQGSGDVPPTAHLIVSNSLFKNNNSTNISSTSSYGGAIYVNSNSEFVGYDCIFENNRAYEGGAIYSVNKVELIRCEFYANYTVGSGGAIYLNNSGLDINACVFENNISDKTGGAIYARSSLITGNDNTFENNNVTANEYGGGGIYSTNSSVELSNSVFKGNSAVNGAGIAAYTNSIIVLINTLATNNNARGSGGFIYINKSTLNMTVDDEGENILGSLTDSTKGNLASVGGGAIFIDENGSSTLSDLHIGYNNAGSSGGGIYAKGYTVINNSIISNNTALYGGAVMAYGTELIINNSMIEYNSSTNAIGGAMYIRESADGLTYSNVTANNTKYIFNYSSGDGGVAYIKLGSTFTANNCTFAYNSSENKGGVIFTNGNVFIYSCTFESNTSKDGGAIYASGCEVTIEDTTFDGNYSTTGSGGAIYTLLSSTDVRTNLRLTNVDFIGNFTTGSNGGALYLSSTDCDFYGGTFANNYSSTNGGAVALYLSSVMNIYALTATGNYSNLGGFSYVNRSTLNIISNESESIIFGTNNFENAEELKNYATSKGGVIYATINGVVNIDGAIFGYNRAAYGGALAGSHANGSDIIVTNSTFIGNNATSNGGAVLGELGSRIEITDSEFIGNIATSSGGAIYIGGSAQLTIDESYFTSNISSGSGGALSINGSTSATVIDSEFISNGASTTGGALQLYSDGTNELTFINCTFDSNASGTNGGAIYHSNSSISILTNLTLINNTAVGLGDGIYNTNASSKTTHMTINGLTLNQQDGDPIYMAQNTSKLAIYQANVVDLNNNPVDFSKIIKGLNSSVINNSVIYL